MARGDAAKAHARAQKRLERQQRTRSLFALRVHGASVAEISEQLAVSRRTVVRTIQQELEKARLETGLTVQQYIALELARLDKVIVTATPHFQRGSAQHGALILRTIERQARLLGVDAEPAHVPAAQEADYVPQGLSGLSLDELDQRIAALRAHLGPAPLTIEAVALPEARVPLENPDMSAQEDLAARASAYERIMAERALEATATKPAEKPNGKGNGHA